LFFSLSSPLHPPDLHSFPTRRSSDLYSDTQNSFHLFPIYSPVSEKRLILSPISSRTRWKSALFSSSVPSAFAGSSKPQCSRLTCGGVIGQLSDASPQSVTAIFAWLKTSVSTISDV